MKNMQGFTYDFVAELDGDIFTPKESIDVIYCHSVLEHIARLEKFFSSAIEILRPSGRLYINSPFMYLEHETPYDFNRFTRYGLDSRLKEAGFSILKLIPSTNAFFGATTFIMQQLRQEELARGFEVRTYTLPDGSSALFLPLLTNIIGAVNHHFDDALYDNASPTGFLCVAEKPEGVP